MPASLEAKDGRRPLLFLGSTGMNNTDEQVKLTQERRREPGELALLLKKAVSLRHQMPARIQPAQIMAPIENSTTFPISAKISGRASFWISLILSAKV